LPRQAERLPYNFKCFCWTTSATCFALQSAHVDAADVSLVRQQTLQPVNDNSGTSDLREDINVSGRIDAADVSIARQQTLTSLP
jgi:hypothetical protein